MAPNPASGERIDEYLARKLGRKSSRNLDWFADQNDIADAGLIFEGQPRYQKKKI